MQNRALPLLALLVFSLPGCASLQWSTTTRPISETFNETRKLEAPAVKVTVASDEKEALALSVLVENRRMVDTRQRIRHLEIGKWRNGADQSKYWFVGAVMHNLLFALSAGLIWREYNDLESGLVALAHGNFGGLAIALPGFAQLLTEGLPPVVRPGRKATVTRSSKELRLPRRSTTVTLSTADGQVLDEQTTDRKGRIQFTVGADSPAALGDSLKVASGGQSASVSLLPTGIHLTAHRATVASLVGSGDLLGAKEHIDSIAISKENGPKLWPDLCAGLRASLDVGGDPVALIDIAAGWPLDLPVCKEAVIAIGVAELRAAQTKGGDLDGVLDQRYKGALKELSAASCTLRRRELVAAVSRRPADEVEFQIPRGASTECAGVRAAQVGPLSQRIRTALSRENLEDASILLEAYSWAANDSDSYEVFEERIDALQERLEQRAEAAEVAAQKRVASSWQWRIKSALTACDTFRKELSRRKNRIYTLQNNFDPRTEREVQKLEDWLSTQEDGAFGDALHDLRSIMDEMEEAEYEGNDTSSRRQELGWRTQDHCGN